MKKLMSLTLTIGAMLFAFASNATTKHVVPNGKRTFYVTGVVDGNVLTTAHKIERLSLESQDPIHLVINSPGGMVFAGFQLTQSMDVARSRGTKIICSVGVLAASMAFQLLPHCDERYAMKNTLLLFHPARVYMRGGLTAEEAASIAESCKKIDQQGLDEVSEMLGGPKKSWLSRHHRAETLWTAQDLVKETNQDWLTLVDDIIVPGGIFNMQNQGSDARSDIIKSKMELIERELEKSSFVIVN